MPAREKTSATFLAAAVEPPGTVERAGEAEIGRLADGCSAKPRYRLLRGELIGRSSRSVAPIILCRQRNYKANSCQCQGKVEMSPSRQNRNVPFSLDLGGVHVNLRVPVKRRRAMLASNPIKE